MGGALLGFAGYLRVPEIPGYFGGYIRAVPIEPLMDQTEHEDLLPPDEFVTPLDDQLAGDAPLQEALRRAGEWVELSRREFGPTFTALEELPIFKPDSQERKDHPVISRGVYLRDEEYTYLIDLQPRCSDRWWIETKGTPTGANSCRW